jgi:6-phosphogluconolactonase
LIAISGHGTLTEIEVFQDRMEASTFVAGRIANLVQEALAIQEETTLILSGGRSPIETYRQLAGAPLPWECVHVMLTDERVVPSDDDRLNEKMVRENLMQSAASAARFEKLDQGRCWSDFSACCALVGMGEDGHFASLFPDLESLAGLLDLSRPPGVHLVSTSASEVDRLTMNLAALVRASRVILLVSGAKKRSIVEKPDGYPVEALLKQSAVPVEVIWAP